MNRHTSNLRHAVSLVTLVCVLASHPTFARADEPLPPIPAAPGSYVRNAQPRSSPVAALTPPGTVSAVPDRTRVPRIAFETFGALLGLGGSAIIGVFGWGLTGVTLCQSTEQPCASAGAIVFAAISSLVLVPLGVVVGSRATRGNGGYLWSMLGAALGLVPGVAGGYWVAQETGETLTSIPVIAVLTLVGGVLGYELSADAPPTASERLFTPVASVDGDGIRVGLRGEF